MRINWEDVLSGLAGGAKGYLDYRQYSDAQKRDDEERSYRRERDEFGDKKDMARINADIQRAVIEAGGAVEKRAREDRDRAVAGGALRSGITTNQDIPEGIRRHFEGLSDADAGALDASAVARLFMDPYTKPAAAQDLETLRQGGRQSLADLNNAAREVIAQINQAGQNQRFEIGEAGRNRRANMAEGGRNARQETQIDATARRDSVNNAARAQRDSVNNTSFADLIAKHGGGSNRSTGPGGDTRLPPVTVSPNAQRDQKRQDLDAAIKALRSKGTPKKDWPPAVLRAMRELGIS
jgi:hypothetical protein